MIHLSQKLDDSRRWSRFIAPAASLAKVNQWRRLCVGETGRLHGGHCCSCWSAAQVQRQTETVADSLSSIQIRLPLQCQGRPLLFAHR